MSPGLVLLITWLLLAMLTAAIAWGKGRSGLGWFCLAVLLGPVALLSAVVRRSRVKCPFCREFIKPGATVCRFCGRDLVTPLKRQPPRDSLDVAFREWLVSQGVDPESLDAGQLAQLKTAFEQSAQWSPGY